MFSTDNGSTVIGHYPDAGSARRRAEEERAEGKMVAMQWHPTSDVEVTFPIEMPTLRHALEIRFLTAQHLSGPNIADMLGVELSSLHEALAVLERENVLGISDRDTVAETWHLVAPLQGMNDLLASAARKRIDLGAPLKVRT